MRAHAVITMMMIIIIILLYRRAHNDVRAEFAPHNARGFSESLSPDKNGRGGRYVSSASGRETTTTNDDDDGGASLILNVMGRP